MGGGFPPSVTVTTLRFGFLCFRCDPPHSDTHITKFCPRVCGSIEGSSLSIYRSHTRGGRNVNSEENVVCCCPVISASGLLDELVDDR